MPSGPLYTLTQDRASDRPSVDLIGLTGLSFATTGGTHQFRCDPQHSLPRSNERLLEMVRQVAAILYRPSNLPIESVCPAQRFEMPLLPGSDLSLAQ
jgi:hypothetical protein